MDEQFEIVEVKGLCAVLPENLRFKKISSYDAGLSCMVDIKARK